MSLSAGTQASEQYSTGPSSLSTATAFHDANVSGHPSLAHTLSPGRTGRLGLPAAGAGAGAGAGAQASLQ